MRVLTRTRLPRGAHIVDNGRVGCPIRGADVDVEECLTCPRLTGVGEDGALTYVTCRTASPLADLPVPPWFG